MDKQTLQDWLTWSFSPSISAILVTLFICLVTPPIVHFFLYRSGTASSVPSFLLLGPSGAGKTTLLTLLERGAPTSTHTSQAPQSVTCKLPSGATAKSSEFRSENDPSHKAERRFEVTDTPGHGKLRHHALTALASSTGLNGLIFVVDAAALSSAAGLTEAATYLHDVLLSLQKRHTGSKNSTTPSTAVLIAANKLDLFTALPASLVKKKLQDEISKIRATRAKGLLDSGVGTEGDDEEREWLGEGGEGKFEFEQMEESGVEVVVAGGNVTGKGEEKAHADEWWAWIAQQM
ncbi:hypothetical protein MBLNU459_g0144t1 [Dothideomycetes sp. NU459]